MDKSSNGQASRFRSHLNAPLVTKSTEVAKTSNEKDIFSSKDRGTLPDINTSESSVKKGDLTADMPIMEETEVDSIYGSLRNYRTRENNLVDSAKSFEVK